MQQFGQGEDIPNDEVDLDPGFAEQFERQFRPACQLYLISPPAIDDRILHQLALFSLISSPAAALDDWLRDRPELYRRVVVPARLKREIRDKLDQANINERVLFPGLDGLSRWLTRYYTPATKPELEAQVDDTARRRRGARPARRRA